MANANSKAIHGIFCGVSTNEFHKISHVQMTKEAWKILETTYEGTKKVNDIKLQILTTHFEEVNIGKDESLTLSLVGSKKLGMPNSTLARRLMTTRL